MIKLLSSAVPLVMAPVHMQPESDVLMHKEEEGI